MSILDELYRELDVALREATEDRARAQERIDRLRPLVSKAYAAAKEDAEEAPDA